MNFLDHIQEIFSFQFMQRAFLAGTLVGIISPLIGNFVVIKKYSAIGDSLSHIGIFALAFSISLGIESNVVSLVITLFFSLGIELLRQKKLVSGETSIVIFTVLSLSLLSILQSKANLGINLESLLFGSLTTVKVQEIQTLVFLTILLVILIFLNYRQLLNLSISEELAKVGGLPVIFYNYFLISLVAIVVSFSIPVIGGLLVSGLLVLPVASSQQFNLNFKNSYFLAIFFGVLQVWIGIFLAWFSDFPMGGSIALVGSIIFIISAGFKILKNFKFKGLFLS